MRLLLSIALACSGAGVKIAGASPRQAPPAVKRMHAQILDAATDCDIPRLERLALAGRKRFDYTFGKPIGPAKLWKKQEAHGAGFLRQLIQVLKMPYGMDGKTYVWPAAFAKSADEKSYRDLANVFGERQMILWRDYGGYTGLRTAITADGDWIYCIDGD